MVKSANGATLALPPAEPSSSAQLPEQAGGYRRGNSFTLILCLAWLAAMGLAVMALLRTY